MREKYFTVKEVKLNNHCPECYSTEGLILTFKQRFVDTTFYRAISTDTKCSIHCDNCDMEIFPVRWTEEIEQVVKYQTRAFVPKPATTKLKQITWILLIVAVVAIIALNVFVFMR